MKKLITLALFISATALAAETTNPNGTPTGAPKESCEAIVKAGIDNNFKAFMELTILPVGKDCKDKSNKEQSESQSNQQAHCETPEMIEKKLEEGFHKTHEKHLDLIKSIICKDEKIVGGYAWVEATSKEDSRLIPFRVVDGKWKFDMKTYHAFYHSDKASMMK